VQFLKMGKVAKNIPPGYGLNEMQRFLDDLCRCMMADTQGMFACFVMEMSHAWRVAESKLWVVVLWHASAAKERNAAEDFNCAYGEYVRLLPAWLATNFTQLPS
jgi:hypothetical protein